MVFGIPGVQQSCGRRILEILNSVQQSETLSKSTSTRNWPEKLCIKAVHKKFQKIPSELSENYKCVISFIPLEGKLFHGHAKSEGGVD